MINHKKHSGNDYKYGCVKIDLDVSEDFWESIINNIEDEDLYKPEIERYGKETEPHITILFGLHDIVSDDDVIYSCKSFKTGNLDIEIDKINSFSNSEFDVIKMDVLSEDLHYFNSQLSKLPNTQSYDQYRPHVTISYLLPGKGIKYHRELSEKIIITSIKRFVYSKTNGEVIVIEI